jgi:PIN domain nuclease of toxin-antitoxin system
MWVWFHGESRRLPTQLTQAMENPKTRIGISAVSVWETMVAIEKALSAQMRKNIPQHSGQVNSAPAA